MTFKKITGKIHLWLGLSSGIIVCFLGITGCLLVFEKEIEILTVPEQFVKAESKPYLSPSVLKSNAEKSLGKNRKIISIEYEGRNKAALAYYYNAEEYFLVLLNPYNGNVLRVKNMNRDFFRVVINGHYYLWLPPAIGQPIVATATLVFVMMLITGIVLWWPKNKAARKQRFSIKWNASFKRKNYDLHNVLGFYVTWITVFIAVSGLVMGFQWFANSVYFVSSGGKIMPAYPQVISDTLKVKSNLSPFASTDVIFHKMAVAIQPGEGIGVEFPTTKDAAVELSINHKVGTYYNRDNYYFDQYTLKEIAVKGVYAGKYKDASAADKIQRMNYDIHVGAIGGLPTKILAFLGSAIAASLPITGFLIWRGRKKKAKYKKPIARAVAVV